MTETSDETLKAEIRGSLGQLTLARPKALNALTEHMRSRISERLWAFARDPQVYAVVLQSESPRAFSVGSDVREVIGLARADLAAGRKTFADEYALNWQCECFSKPTVPLINGMVMGGGVGITQFGTHRVAGELYSFSMPETLIGLFPDVGVCHVLARLPDQVGMYLGLTGRSIGRAEAYALGLVTHCIDSQHFEAIKADLADTWPVDTILDDRNQDCGAGELHPYRALIARCFSAERVEEIIARLDGEAGAQKEWASAVAADLRRRSPLALKITHRHIREARTRDLRETLVVDYRIAARILEANGDFYEGVRAALVDKDGAPRWAPSRLEDVTEQMVDAYFAPLGEGGDLVLPSREEMQKARA
ncbi:enoyl-CoA hydratase/isomerase family protein [Hyphomicrobium sp. LHD-15]|uniref:enoyl-CoA hydratase/isomerase family protein n=1 Tax=Hyphomicrobium sp. LHD-15 TaxID=3072142 RepID=UPI00280EC4FA|nr:enoyl-CoA hydratase/isomerase family protein [Hyphomicrobium sp. LHD-15]MDQ8700092.1 enoyl-CoA hydratase/isomerase family protein [Hyphomicrobium sp. LHD-15]